MGSVYFVSFFSRGSALNDELHYRDLGIAEITLPEPITTISQIREAEAQVAGQTGGRVKILFYRFLRMESEEERKRQEEAAFTLPLFDQPRLVDINS